MSTGKIYLIFILLINELYTNKLFYYKIRGPVQSLGCLEKIVNWVPPYLNAWGSMMILTACLQVNFILLFFI